MKHFFLLKKFCLANNILNHLKTRKIIGNTHKRYRDAIAWFIGQIRVILKKKWQIFKKKNKKTTTKIFSEKKSCSKDIKWQVK